MHFDFISSKSFVVVDVYLLLNFIASLKFFSLTYYTTTKEIQVKMWLKGFQSYEAPISPYFLYFLSLMFALYCFILMYMSSFGHQIGMLFQLFCFFFFTWIHLNTFIFHLFTTLLFLTIFCEVIWLQCILYFLCFNASTFSIL